MSKVSKYTERKCKRIMNSIINVIEDEDMRKLTKQAYDFTIIHLGFIAHNNHRGFIGVYEQIGVDKFKSNLLTGEIGFVNYNRDRARMFLNGSFNNQYTEEECKNIGETIYAIIEIAKQLPFKIRIP